MSLGRLVPCFLVLATASLPTLFSSQTRRSALWVEGARVIIGDESPVIENAAFLVEGDSFTWVGKKGERQPPANATRLDLTGKTVMPTLIDGHNHIGLVNEKDGTNKKANYTRENLIDQLQRYAYYGTAATLSMGLEADQELAYKLREDVIPNAAKFLTVGKGIAATSMAGPPAEARLGIPYGATTPRRAASTFVSCTNVVCISSSSGLMIVKAPYRSSNRRYIARSSTRPTKTEWKPSRTSAARLRSRMQKIS